MKALIRAALILTLSLSGMAQAAPEISIGTCKGAFNEAGDSVTIKPFNSTICGDDELARIMFKLFPVASELVSSSAFLELENRETFIKHALSEKEERSYSVRLDAIEQSGVTITKLFAVFAGLAFIFHLVSKMFTAKTVGDGNLKPIWKYTGLAAICYVLAYPISYGGRINPEGQTNIATALSTSLVLGGIGFSNQAISTTAYLMSQRGLSNEIVRGLEIEPSEKEAYAQAKELFEEAMCLDSVALVSVYDAAANERMAARRSILRGAQLETLSFKNDGNTSRFTIDADKAVIESGWRLNDDEHRALCTSRKLTAPSSGDIDESVKRAADKIADKLQFESLDSNKLIAAWEELKGELDDKASVATQRSVSEYLFSRILWRLGGGDVTTNKVSRKLFNDRVAKASAFAREIRASKCYADYRGFRDSEATVKDMNIGRVGSAQFTLDCAIVRNGQLEMIFDGDASSAEAFAKRALEEMSEHPYKAVQLHEDLMKTFEPEVLVKKTLTNVHATILVDEAVEETGDNGFYDRVVEARLKGVMMFGTNGVRMIESWLNVKGVLLNTQAEASAIESTIAKDSYYVGENGFLPADVEFEMSEFVMPAFVYYVPAETDNNDAATQLVESQLESQLDGGQGGTASGMVKSTGAIYEHAGAQTTTTQTEMLDESAGTIIDSLTTVALNIESTKGLSDGDIRRATNEMCLSDATSKSDIEKLGITVGQYNAICARNSMLAISHYKSLGFKSVDHAAALIVVGTASKSGGKLMTMFKKKKADKGATAKHETDGQISGKPMPSTGLPSSFKSKVMGTVTKLANASFIQYISGLLVGMTVAFATITTVIYLLPSLMFSFGIVGLLGFVIIFTALSGVVAMACVMWGGDLQRTRQPVASAIVNLLLKMLVAVVALYLSIGAIQVADMLSTLAGVSAKAHHTSNGLGFASGLVFNLLFAVVNLVFLLWLMRSGTSIAHSVTDKLERMMGGTDTGSSSEQAVNTAVVFASQGVGAKAKSGADALNHHLSK